MTPNIILPATIPMEQYKNSSEFAKKDDIKPDGPRQQATIDIRNRPILSIRAPLTAPEKRNSSLS